MTATDIIWLAAVLSVFWIAACDGSPAPAAELETMTRKVAKKFTEVRQLSTADLAAWLADPERKPPQLLDAREPAEFAVSHLCRAIRVGPDASAEQLLARIDRARPNHESRRLDFQIGKRRPPAGPRRQACLRGASF